MWCPGAPAPKNVANWQTQFFSPRKSLRPWIARSGLEFANRGKLTGKLAKSFWQSSERLPSLRTLLLFPTHGAHVPRSGRLPRLWQGIQLNVAERADLSLIRSVVR